MEMGPSLFLNAENFPEFSKEVNETLWKAKITLSFRARLDEVK